MLDIQFVEDWSEGLDFTVIWIFAYLSALIYKMIQKTR